MDIDLLFTREGEAGLISDKNLVKKLAGVLFDTQTGLMTLEYVDMENEDLNIPVGGEFYDRLDICGQLNVGAVKDGEIAQAYQVPLMFVDDPYRGEAMKTVSHSPRPLQEFEAFMRRCVTGQPVHREDLGDEDKMGCVLGEASPVNLQFAPHLARRHAMEVTPKAAPSGPGPSAPGLGGGGGGAGRVIRRPPDEDSE